MNVITKIDETITEVKQEEVTLFKRVKSGIISFFANLCGNAGNCWASCNKAFCNIFPESCCVETADKYELRYKRRCHREEVELRVVEEPQDDFFWRWHARELGLSFDDINNVPYQGTTNESYQEMGPTNNVNGYDSSDSESGGQSCLKFVTVTVEVHAEMDSHDSQEKITEF